MKIRQLLPLALSLTIGGCVVTFDRETPSKETSVDSPTIGEVNTAYVGDIIMSKGIKMESEAIVLKSPVEGFFYDIPSGTYDMLGANKDWRIFTTITRDHKMVLTGPFAEQYQALGVKYSNSKQLCVITTFGTYECYEADFEIKRELSMNEASFQQTLVYSGKVGNIISIAYLESGNNVASLALNNNVEYDLNESRNIRYKDAVIEVLSADNQKITYRIMKSFK
jgi:hypothetical protein